MNVIFLIFHFLCFQPSLHPRVVFPPVGSHSSTDLVNPVCRGPSPTRLYFHPPIAPDHLPTIPPRLHVVIIAPHLHPPTRMTISRTSSWLNSRRLLWACGVPDPGKLDARPFVAGVDVSGHQAFVAQVGHRDSIQPARVSTGTLRTFGSFYTSECMAIGLWSVNPLPLREPGVCGS